ncbi:hypothetical protein [Elongatibacter sediminis]|uniref:Uncharacterized protein n=1 Tax=Elongatibacter sediminis TaxID=3119006 RepID=A0AAW9RDB7_9GAMM
MTNAMMKKISASLLLCVVLVAPAAAQTADPRLPPAKEAPPTAPVSLSELAARADAVVLAQARDADYVYRREFPVGGTAYLRVLIPYKLDPDTDIIEVYEEGLHEHECYFPNPTVFEEGRRYLLFLKRDPDKQGRYRGMPEGCALEVLVDEHNRYAVRLPITGIDLTDPLETRAQPMNFADAYARETEESLSPDDRDAWLEAGWLRPTDDGYTYTRGLDLTTVRRLMGPAALGRD